MHNMYYKLGKIQLNTNLKIKIICTWKYSLLERINSNKKIFKNHLFELSTK